MAGIKLYLTHPSPADFFSIVCCVPRALLYRVVEVLSQVEWSKLLCDNLTDASDSSSTVLRFTMSSNEVSILAESLKSLKTTLA